MSDTGPLAADTTETDEKATAPTVRVLLTLVPGADLKAAFAVVDRQVYEPAPDVHVVGKVVDEDLPESVVRHDTLEAAIEASDSDVEYLWLLHADARPRPDALHALVAEIDRNEASLAGSKLLKAGTMDELESVGGATDVFGEPYSGLDEGEIDLQQYDVVREVAFVSSASMLVRRDLARGLRGLDPLLPPIAAGLDFSQRTRLAGGRVITVPSSEVYHQGRCNERGPRWREQAGRLRAMVTAYSPLTLLWLLPFDLVVAVLDSLGSLLLLKWKPLVRHVYAFAWNTFHLPSTIGQRRRFKKVRATGDEELFRFQASGSVRLRSVGGELSSRFLSLFDDDQAFARSTDRVWRSPGIWGAIIAAIVVLLSARGLIFGEMPNTGMTFPFEPPTTSLGRWFAGWNDAGLGSPAAVHPSVSATGLASWVWFGAEGAARTLLTIGAGFVGVVGMGRLAGRLGLRGAGRYLSGVVLLAGPALAFLIGVGSWLALMAASLLPWAVRAVFAHPTDRRTRLSRMGWAVVGGLLVASFSPALIVAPLAVTILWRLAGGANGSILLGLACLTGGVVAAGFVVGDPGWLFDVDRRLGVDVPVIWIGLVVVTAIAMVFRADTRRRVAVIGGTLSLGALVALKVPFYGPGIEEGLGVLASFGAGLTVASAMDDVKFWSIRIVAAAGSIAMLVLAVGVMGNGRMGLPQGDDNGRLAFAISLASESGPGRILHASVDRNLISGESRPGPGFWYRVLDGSGTTHDEVYLPEPLEGDVALDEALAEISIGADLRPGAHLAGFSIDWVVLEGPVFVLDEILSTQLDLVPTPVDREARVFENPASGPLVGNDSVSWQRDGAGFSGPPVSSTVRVAANYDDGWGPAVEADQWAMSVDGQLGDASYSGATGALSLAIATLGLAVTSIAFIAIGRRKR